MPVPTYVFGPSNSDHVKYYICVEGEDIVPNVTYMGKYPDALLYVLVGISTVTYMLPQLGTFCLLNYIFLQWRRTIGRQCTCR